VLDHKPLYCTEFRAPKATAFLKADGIKPEFGNIGLTLNMDMRRLVAVS